MRECLVCFKEFEPQGPKDYFCSDNCRGIAAPYKELFGARATACAYCGKHFWQRESVSKYCSTECKGNGRPRGYHRRNTKPYKAREPRPAKTYGTKICEWCGAEYIAKQPYQKWCSNECRWHGSYKMAHPNHRTIEERHIARETRTLTCKQCGKEFHPKYRGEQTYCSRACQHKGRTKKTMCICSGCGKEYMPRDRAYNKYCSRDCYFKKQTQKKERNDAIKNLIRTLANIHDCPACGVRYIGTGICCPACAKDYYKQRAKERQLQQQREMGIKVYYNECKDCGRVFATNKRLVKYCSTRCRKHGENRSRERRTWKKLRANGYVDYSITLTKLVKRDKGICHICGSKVDIKADSNSGLYPSIDHIIPKSKGGTHTWDNVALAHRDCNSKKQASMVYKTVNGQLALAV